MKLSICIPTYNRSSYLRELLESICKQINGKYEELVEIAISDNASSDDTDKMVCEIQNKYPRVSIIYSKAEENKGADRNYIRAVDISTGDYVWIVGSDDLMQDGVFDYLFQELGNQTVYLSNRENYSIDLSENQGLEYFLPIYSEEEMVIQLDSVRNWAFYLNLCTSLGGVFSYLSSFITKREIWDSKKDYEDYIGTAYVHVYIVLSYLLSHIDSSIKILNKPIIKCRLGNDSFLGNPHSRVKAYKRLMIDYDGYLKLSPLFNNKELKKDFLRILIRQHPCVYSGILVSINKEQKDRLINDMKLIGYDPGVIFFTEEQYKHKISTIIMNSGKIIKKICK